MIPEVVAVEALDNQRLHVTFADGRAGDIGLRDVVSLTGVFAPLVNQELFRSVYVDHDLGTVAWPGGVDIDPVALYAGITGQTPIEIIAAEQTIRR
jgi:hypothetical protein